MIVFELKLRYNMSFVYPDIKATALQILHINKRSLCI